MNDSRLRDAIRYYWAMRDSQANTQLLRGAADQGLRGAVTGGKQMDGFVSIIVDILLAAAIEETEIHFNRSLELPGYFRPEKKWDIVVVVEKHLVAALELKSMASSFGNNLNNRVEEAVGSATDLWTAYREGAFPAAPKPWLGFLMLLVETEQSTKPVAVREPHFAVFPEFKNSSYAERCRIMLEKLMRERLYDATSFLLASDSDKASGYYSEPSQSSTFRLFEESLRAHVSQFQRLRT